MTSKLFHLAKIAKELPLPILATRCLQKLGLDSTWSRRIDLLYSEDAKRPLKAAKILFDSLLKAGFPTNSLTEVIPDSVILEIGCGRYAGLAPFALGIGARHYIGVDPSLDGQQLLHPLVRKHYLEPALDTAKNFAQTLDFSYHPSMLSGSDGVAEMLKRCSFKKSGIGDLDSKLNKIDVCVSISCLEHIRDFKAAASAMAKISHSNTMHIHIVNFSNHLSKQAPFHQLYEMPYAEFGKRWNHNVNGLRMSDMLFELKNTGLVLHAYPLDIKPEALPVRIDSTWLERYSHDELAIRTVLLTTLHN